MSQTPIASLPAGSDTPVDERPPYGDAPGWRRALAVGLVLAFLLGCAILVGLVVRAVWRLATGAPKASPERQEVIMFPMPDQPYAGPVYRIEFFDGAYRQLTDKHIAVALPALHGPAADAALYTLARELKAEVEARDSQRCFHPRVVVYAADGTILRTWVAV